MPLLAPRGGGAARRAGGTRWPRRGERL